MRTIVVTGGAGFIGINFVHYWRERYLDDRIVVVDAGTYASNIPALDEVENCTVIKTSICSTDELFSAFCEYRPETIFNFAAETHVDNSIENPNAFLEANTVGIVGLLNAFRRYSAQEEPERSRLHQVSTDEVFGSLGKSDPGSREGDSYRPNSPYAASKASADHFVRAYHRTFGLNVTGSYCANNFGPHQFPEKLIPKFLHNILHGEPLPVYGSGKQRRSWVHVSDHCRALDVIAAQAKPGEFFNVPGLPDMPNTEVVEMLCAVVDGIFAKQAALADRFPHCPSARGEPVISLLAHVTDRAGHDLRYRLDPQRYEVRFGPLPLKSFGDGLTETVIWYLENPEALNRDAA